MKNIIYICLILIFSSCSSPVSKKSQTREYQIGAYLWQQTSGEYKALCYQAYNLARSELEKSLSQQTSKKKAIILDIDETVFDNSRSGTFEIKNNLPWSPGLFNDWVKKKQAMAIAGAIDFLTFAQQNSVEIFYITNRAEDQIDDTLANFKNLGMPAKLEHIYPLRKAWSKELRRNEIQEKFDVVLYVGDNLHDFNSDFDNKTSDERVRKKFILS